MERGRLCRTLRIPPPSFPMRPLALATLVALLVPCALAQDAPPDSTEGPTLVDLLEADGRFTTLLDAVDTAGLAETLAEPGPYTLFAPTDSAFAALPEGALAALTPEELQSVLLHHVVFGAVTGAEAAEAGTAPSAWSERELAFAAREDGTLLVNGATVVEADLEASNGLLHVIDAVLLPPADDADDGMEDDGM